MSAFSFARFGMALAIMVGLLVVLVVLMARLRPLRASQWLAERACVVWPFDLYLSWISVALIANSFPYAHVVGFGGFGIAESTWSVAMMIVATILGVVLAYAQGVWLSARGRVGALRDWGAL